MKIGILTADRLSDELVDQFGPMPDMFERLLLSADDQLEFETFDVYLDDFPCGPAQCDAWIITGSTHSAFEELPWIIRLKAFVREVLGAGVPMVGICFGHQLMAEAMGGKVEREPNGNWGAAVHNYQINANGPRPYWMVGEQEAIALQASHQDQVVTLPPGSERLGGNDFCPNGIIAYGQHGLSMQLHPELSSAFIESIFKQKRGEVMPEEQVDEALSRVNDPVDDARAAAWIVHFMRHRTT